MALPLPDEYFYANDRAHKRIATFARTAHNYGSSLRPCLPRLLAEYWRARGERHRHFLQAGHEVRRPQRQRGIRRQPHIRNALQQAGLHDRQLQPGELVAQAEVRPEAEREVVVRVALDVEGFRILEDLFVEVRRLEQQDHLLALVQLGAVKLVVGGDRAGHVLHRRRPSQHFFDRVGQQFQVVDQTLVLIGVLQQLPGPAGQRVTGGLVTADQQQQDLGEDLVVLEPRTLDLRVHQDADQIVGRLLLARRDHSVHVFGVGGEGIHRDLHVFFGRSAAQCADQFVGPFEEHLAVLRTHTEHVPDDRHGQGRGEVPDEVTLAALTYRVDQRVAQQGDLGLQVFHPLAGEPVVDELAAQQMLRIVHLDHHLDARLVGPDAAGVREQLGFAFGLDDGLIRRRGGQPVAVPEDRLVLPHPAIKRVRVTRGEKGGGQMDIWFGR